jgi:hypothetical protein
MTAVTAGPPGSNCKVETHPLVREGCVQFCYGSSIRCCDIFRVILAIVWCLSFCCFCCFLLLSFGGGFSALSW